MVKMIFKNANKSFSLRSGFELLTLYRINPDMPLKFGCGKGQCGTCLIKVVEGQDGLSKPTKQEMQTLAAKQLPCPLYRLACQCAILDDVVID